MQARPRALGAPAVDRRAGEIEVAHAQAYELRGVARAGSRAGSSRGCARRGKGFSWRNQEGGDFVADEVVAQALFAGHANNLPRTPSPFKSRQRKAIPVTPRRTQKGPRPRRTEPLPTDWCSGFASLDPSVQSVASFAPSLSPPNARPPVPWSVAGKLLSRQARDRRYRCWAADAQPALGARSW